VGTVELPRVHGDDDVVDELTEPTVEPFWVHVCLQLAADCAHTPSWQLDTNV